MKECKITLFYFLGRGRGAQGIFDLVTPNEKFLGGPAVRVNHFIPHPALANSFASAVLITPAKF